MERDEAERGIQRELGVAEQSIRIGNAGRARVCARRAVGIAIAYWLQRHPDRGWGTDAMTRLHRLREDEGVPDAVRNAARRLTTKITEQFTPAFPTDPLEDCRIIVAHMLGDA